MILYLLHLRLPIFTPDAHQDEDDNYLEDFPDMASDLIIQSVISGEINENLLLGSLSYSICAPPTASNKSISDIPSPSLVKLVDKDFSYYTLLDSNEVSNLMSDLGLSSFEATRKAAKFAAVQVFAKNQFASPFSVTPL
ncbi:unnamed protein product [Rhizophagus irregularis]|uniref:Uncharacterized protein n=1 Tax=Rhizophagus irregularis TaxID=588596 RepID=A0A916EE88_9GLOM|nr:unnamed protein product [Rhizophagus irregularis]CAB5375799.1 unnamed protein product [Rhizophagus irregularis]